MFSNKNIVKYCVKYFVLLTLTAYTANSAADLANQKSDYANLVGSALFAGLLIAWVLILKSDVTKLVQNIKNENKKNDE